jgi:hypothetical protein
MSDVTTEPEYEAVDDAVRTAEPEALEAVAEMAEAGGSGSEGGAEPEPAPEPGPEPEWSPEPEPEPAAEPAGESEPEPIEQPMTLDELVADLAKPEEESPAEAAVAIPEQPEAEPEPAAEPAGEPEPETAEEPGAAQPLLKRLWTNAPFWAVDGVWLTLTVAATIALWNVPSLTYQDGALYALLVLGGAALSVIGLVAGLVIWLVARTRSLADERVGLALTIWTRALSWTAAGVAQWWVGLLLLSLHHQGVIG